MLSISSPYKKKLYGWLSYAFASEVFVIVSLTLFLPICLEQFARDNGYLAPDRTEPCSAVKAIPLHGNATAGAAGDKMGTLADAERCEVKIGWAWIDTASFSLYVYSISVALQALTVISMGGIADHPPHRKKLLLLFAALGSASATLFLLLPSDSSVWHLSALLAMFANVSFGASVVAMNAYLPGLAKESPEVVELLQETVQDEGDESGPITGAPDDEYTRDINHSLDSTIESESSEAPLIPRHPPESHSPTASSSPDTRNKYDTALSRATSRISSLGIAMGYAAGIFLLIVALVPVTKLHGSTFALRLAIGLSGIWWAIFSIPAAVWLPGAAEDAGKRLSDEEVGEEAWTGRGEGEREWKFWKEIYRAWVRLGRMLKWSEVVKLKNTFKYLAAWFLLSDGFTTITSTAVLFAKTSLHMPASSLILIGVITPASGIIGSLLWPHIQRKFRLSNLTILTTLVLLASLIPLYGCLGFLTQNPNSPIHFGGLTTPGEMFGLAVIFGSVYGAFQGYARAFYAELIPAGEEARWYGLFSITDKSSSFLGPLVVGIIADVTGNIRWAFFFLVGMVWVGAGILAGVDVERGRRDVKGYVYEGGR
ncbi:MFS general substrate transporter [Macrolepiota fuliginosa MF-IS2]|uniref:Autophagy-related protein n=1 Tax=Macrolepiota fuliginosa MF-IS2 TaxID=1400762 RepID=A0A9P6BZC2_9AGAR|nr:MFS general substrate transporter [Macrolepiota fuliginosa MF-IS2]